MQLSKPTIRLLLVAFDKRRVASCQVEFGKDFDLTIIDNLIDLEHQSGVFDNPTKPEPIRKSQVRQHTQQQCAQQQCTQQQYQLNRNKLLENPGYRGNNQSDIVVYLMSHSKSDFYNIRYVRQLFPRSLFYIFTSIISIPLLQVAIREKIEEVLIFPFTEYSRLEFMQSINSYQKLPESNLQVVKGANQASLDETSQLRSYKFSPIVILLNNIEVGFKCGTSIQDFSSDINLSTSRLCHMFKDISEMTCSQYLICRKLEEATMLLLQADLPITSVAYQLGFANPSHFSRAFKEHLGITPKSYSEGNRHLECSNVYSQYQSIRVELFPRLYDIDVTNGDVCSDQQIVPLTGKFSA
ncbi:helix-turn-helix domain-containing protein [Thalassotalea litorea]|uniref:helix-turn-helix domain-containing protein n=1 Tax=Thalassotalea litorea TaxID=2020715 RepID=UPI0037352349